MSLASTPTRCRTTRQDRHPRPTDIHVGARIRLRRTLKGLSQGKLAEALGKTFQQIQKYERGTNRVSASVLWDITEALDVPISFFFDGLPTTAALPATTEIDLEHPQILGGKEMLTLARAYYRIKNPDVRKRVVELARSLAQLDSAPAASPLATAAE